MDGRWTEGRGVCEEAENRDRPEVGRRLSHPQYSLPHHPPARLVHIFAAGFASRTRLAPSWATRVPSAYELRVVADPWPSAGTARVESKRITSTASSWHRRSTSLDIATALAVVMYPPDTRVSSMRESA